VQHAGPRDVVREAALAGVAEREARCHDGSAIIAVDTTRRSVGVLLAAGAGRRYGKPKVLVDGWLETAVGALGDGGCAEIVLVLGAADVAVPPGLTAITVPLWHEGLSASVRAGLAQADRMNIVARSTNCLVDIESDSRE